MNLAYALRLGLSPRIAFIGSGGKTTALFILAQELLANAKQLGSPPHILLTATTHLAVEQTHFADHHFIVTTEADLFNSPDDLPDGILLFTGLIDDDNRTSGLSRSVLETIHTLSQKYHLPLLIEADGSRQRPLKAPGPYEPVVPEWIESVVLVAGLSALGRPLSDKWVHRSEQFSQISGLPHGAPITEDSLYKVLTSPTGGLKGIPSTARRIILLNQADTPILQASGHRLGVQLLSSYPMILISSLAPGNVCDAAKEEPQPPSISVKVQAVIEPVAGILLAAGESSRLGQPKQILTWQGQPLVRHVASIALTAGLQSLIVVTGAHQALVEAALSDLPLNLTHNPYWQSGQSSSIQAGMRVLPQETGSVIFFLSDQPLINERLVRSLIDTHTATLSSIVAPIVEHQRSNPVLFDRSTFNDLLGLQGDMGGRVLFSRFPVNWLPWNDPRITLDIDTLQDYERLLSLGGDPKSLANQ